MKMPENSAVIDTAVFMTLVATPRSAAIAGAIFRVVCANSQKASTPRMMPKRSLSSPRYEAWDGLMSLVSRRIFRSGLPTLALCRLAEDRQRPVVPDRQTPHGERRKESRHHRFH